MIVIGVVIGLILDLGTGALVDIAKVQIGVEDFEQLKVCRNPVWATEGFAFFNDLLFSGILLPYFLLSTWCLNFMERLNPCWVPNRGQEKVKWKPLTSPYS